VSSLSRLSLPTILPIAGAVLAAGLALSPSLLGQNPTTTPGASGTSSSNPDESAPYSPTGPRIAQPERGGSAITLETSEPLFYLAVSLNACGYDSGLDQSSPVRLKVRAEINDELAASAPARDARDALCAYIRQHALNDPGHSLAQYVSLALLLSPPPALAPTMDTADMPVESAQVVDILPLVRDFAEAVRLNALWVEHRAEYDALITRVHGPMTQMVLDTNIYLHLPVSQYDGRRFMVLLEPMLAPSETNARYDGNDSVVVVSPKAGSNPPDPQAGVPMDLIRHTYLHFTIEPLVYARSSAMDRLTPLLKPVQNAPLEFTYKNDIVALLTECLIKAVEAQTMDVGIARPVKPSFKDHSDEDRYDAEVANYDRQAEQVRRRRVDLDMRQGWVLVDYFYNQLGAMGKESISLKDSIGPMVYGMDVDREQHHDRQIVFLPEGSNGDVMRRAPRKLAGLDLAEMKLMKGDADGAQEIAEADLKTNPSDPEAYYLLGRIDLIHGDPGAALEHLTQTIQLSHDPRTIAWAHIYLGRMYDIAHDPNDPDVARPQRAKAIAEYRAALASRDSQPDTKAAAEKGIKEPFALPKRAASSDVQDAAPDDLDPSGKAAKEAYRPSSPQ
jgi:tetratricopeptide (TPR) repeat protein